MRSRSDNHICSPKFFLGHHSTLTKLPWLAHNLVWHAPQLLLHSCRWSIGHQLGFLSYLNSTWWGLHSCTNAKQKYGFFLGHSIAISFSIEGHIHLPLKSHPACLNPAFSWQHNNHIHLICVQPSHKAYCTKIVNLNKSL